MYIVAWRKYKFIFIFEVVYTLLGTLTTPIKVMFSFSNRFCPGQKLETSCGSLAYSAPEILLGDSYDAPAVGQLTYLTFTFVLAIGLQPFALSDMGFRVWLNVCSVNEHNKFYKIKF